MAVETGTASSLSLGKLGLGVSLGVGSGYAYGTGITILGMSVGTVLLAGATIAAVAVLVGLVPAGKKKWKKELKGDRK